MKIQWTQYKILSVLELLTVKYLLHFKCSQFKHSKKYQLIYWYGHFVERTVSAEFRAVTDAATRGVLWKKVFLEISQNSQENTCARVLFLIKLQGSGLQLF